MAFQRFTLTDMQSLLSNKYEGAAFWTAIEATNAINESLLMWNALTGYWVTSVTFPSTAGNFEYALPASLVFGTRVTFNGVPLNQASMWDMDSGQPNWQGQTTTSGGNVPITPKTWLPVSIDLIAIWPADAVGGNTIVVEGIAATPRLVSAGDYINVGNETLSALLGYALHILALKEGGARFAATQYLYLGFLKEAAKENIYLHESKLFRSVIGTDMSRQSRPERESK